MRLSYIFKFRNIYNCTQVMTIIALRTSRSMISEWRQFLLRWGHSGHLPGKFHKKNQGSTLKKENFRPQQFRICLIWLVNKIGKTRCRPKLSSESFIQCQGVNTYWRTESWHLYLITRLELLALLLWLSSYQVKHQSHTHCQVREDCNYLHNLWTVIFLCMKTYLQWYL